MVNVSCILSNTNLDILLLCISTTSRSIVFEVTHKLQSVLNCVLDKSLNLYKSNVQCASRKVQKNSQGKIHAAYLARQKAKHYLHAIPA